jgi:hypothetical protein
MTRESTQESENTDHALGAKGTISQAGRQGGRLPSDNGTQDGPKRANESPAGKTRVKKSDEEG